MSGVNIHEMRDTASRRSHHTLRYPSYIGAAEATEAVEVTESDESSI